MTARKHAGIEVVEGTLHGVSLTVVIAHIHIETRWECPKCATRWSKRGKHHGTQRTCARCKHTFWLRPA